MAVYTSSTHSRGCPLECARQSHWSCGSCRSIAAAQQPTPISTTARTAAATVVRTNLPIAKVQGTASAPHRGNADLALEAIVQLIWQPKRLSAIIRIIVFLSICCRCCLCFDRFLSLIKRLCRRLIVSRGLCCRCYLCLDRFLIHNRRMCLSLSAFLGLCCRCCPCTP